MIFEVLIAELPVAGDSGLLRDVGTCLPNYMVSHVRGS